MFKLFCKHVYKFKDFQTVYMDKESYKQICVKCKNETEFHPISMTHLNQILKERGQYVVAGQIVSELPKWAIKNEDGTFCNASTGLKEKHYKGCFIYETSNGLWRIKLHQEDSFAIHDGFISTLRDAECYIDALDKTDSRPKLDLGD